MARNKFGTVKLHSKFLSHEFKFPLNWLGKVSPGIVLSEFSVVGKRQDGSSYTIYLNVLTGEK